MFLNIRKRDPGIKAETRFRSRRHLLEFTWHLQWCFLLWWYCWHMQNVLVVHPNSNYHCFPGHRTNSASHLESLRVELYKSEADDDDGMMTWQTSKGYWIYILFFICYTKLIMACFFTFLLHNDWTYWPSLISSFTIKRHHTISIKNFSNIMIHFS